MEPARRERREISSKLNAFTLGIRAIAKSEWNGSRAAPAIAKPRQASAMKSTRIATEPTRPISSAKAAKMKSAY